MTQTAINSNAAQRSKEPAEWTAASLAAALRRRRALVLRPLIACVLLGSFYCTVATRRYKATGQIQVQKEASGEFGLESSVMGRDDNSVSSDSLDYNIMLQTEAGILQSPALALVVIRDLHLEPTHDYFPQHPEDSAAARMNRVLQSILFWRKPLEPLTVPLEDSPNRRYEALKIFASHLTVQPVTGTRLIDVSYADPDPQRASAVVNRLIAELGDFTFRQRFTATQQGSSWLTGQLAELKQQMQTLQSREIALQRDTGMFGSDASRNVVLERLASLNQTLTEAESNRILKQAIDQVAASGNPELISSLSGNSSVGAVASMTNTLTLIQNLRAQEASLRAELAQDSVRYGPAYPRQGELQAQLRGVGRSIEDEVHRLGERAHSDYLIAMREEDGARAAFNAQKQAAERLNDSMLAYGLAKQEADSSRDIYETLLAKLKQAGVLQGLKASNITIVALAQVPPPDHPSSPRYLVVFAAALAAGLLLGGAVAGCAELMDNKVRSLEGLERSVGIPLIAVLPVFEHARRNKRRPRGLFGRAADEQPASLMGEPLPPLKLAALDRQPSTFAEGLRSLRTALLLSRSGRPPQVVLITSCLKAEGKTTLALNLAALFAQGGSRVLLVDADLRKPGVALRIGSGPIPGLASALASETTPAVQQPIAEMPNFHVLCGEEVAPFPSELLSSSRMRSLLGTWREEYDFILLDSPPVLPVTDAILLSQISDATLLVARHGQTTQRALCRGAEMLRRQHPGQAALGAVLNGVSKGSGDFYEYFGYQGELYAEQNANA